MAGTYRRTEARIDAFAKEEYTCNVRKMTSSLAALLSVLLITTSASASVCDLSCSFQEMHPGCQAAKSEANDKHTSMSMPPGMDMGPDHSEGMKGPDTGIDAIPDHSNYVSSRMEMTAERFEQAAKPETGTNVTAHHSKTVSFCTHEPCRQVSASIFSSKVDRFQIDSLHWIAVGILSLLNPYITFHRIRVQTPPPKMLALDRLTTSLRI